MTPTIEPGGMLSGQVVDEGPVAVGLGDTLELDDDVPEPRPGRDGQLLLVAVALEILAEEVLVGGDAGLALGLAGLGRHADPLELAGQGALAPRLGLLLDGQPGLFLLEPGGVVALPGDALAAVELQDPAGHVVQEIAVVGHGDDRAPVFLEVPLEPGDGLGVEVVGRLVEEQDVGLHEQEPGQGDAAPLAARKHRDGRFGRRAAQGLHGDLEVVVEVPGVVLVDLLLEPGLLGEQGVHVGLGVAHLVADRVVAGQDVDDRLDALANGLEDGLGGIELRVLLEEADGIALAEGDLADVALVLPGDDAEQGRLARAVEPEDADLGAEVEPERDVLEDLAVRRVDPADPRHGEDDLGIGWHAVIVPESRGAG